MAGALLKPKLSLYSQISKVARRERQSMGGTSQDRTFLPLAKTQLVTYKDRQCGRCVSLPSLGPDFER